MKLLNLATFLTVSVLIFSGCVATNPTPNDKPVVDTTLPMVELTKNGVFVDMQAVGFEWKSISDSRVKGIYIYKQTLNEKEATAFAYYDTVKSRFVTHYMDSDVKPNSKYNYYFKTFSKVSESEASKEISVNTLPPLDSVSWIHVVQEMPRSAKIIWRPHTNQIVKAYLLQRKTLENDEWKDLVTISGRLNAEYIDTELKDDYVYKYRILSLTYNDITSKPSAEVKVVTKALPKTVKEIFATQNLPKKIKITWKSTKKSDFDHYNIYRSENIDGDYELLTSLKELEYIDLFETTDDENVDGLNYFYRVSAVDQDDLESKFEKKSAYGKTLAKPTTPSLVEVEMSGDSLEISWSSKDSRIKSYIVNKKSKKGWFDAKSEEFVDIKGKSFIDTAVEPEVTYLYQVQSVDEFGIKSEPSIEVKFTTTADQGKVIAPKPKEIEDTTQKVVKSKGQSDVVPMDDLDMSVN